MPQIAVAQDGQPAPRRARTAFGADRHVMRGRRRVVHRSAPLAVDADAGIDAHVDQVDDQVDQHEQEGDQQQVGGHHRDVGILHGLDEHQPHARPLEHGFRDDGKGDDQAELQADDGDHRHQRVAQGMAEVDGAVRQAAGAGELDVVGAQYLQHLGAHQARDQRHLEQTERDGRQHQRLEPRYRQQTGAPEADGRHLAAAERGEPAELHGEQVDQQDADQEGRQRDADQRDGQEHLRQPAVAVDARVDAHRDAEHHGEQGGRQRQLEGGRETARRSCR